MRYSIRVMYKTASHYLLMFLLSLTIFVESQIQKNMMMRRAGLSRYAWFGDDLVWKSLGFVGG